MVPKKVIDYLRFLDRSSPNNPGTTVFLFSISHVGKGRLAPNFRYVQNFRYVHHTIELTTEQKLCKVDFVTVASAASTSQVSHDPPPAHGKGQVCDWVSHHMKLLSHYGIVALTQSFLYGTLRLAM